MKKEKKKPQINPESKAENTTIKEIEPKKEKNEEDMYFYISQLSDLLFTQLSL